MNIYEAAKEALATKRYIKRKSCILPNRILPTPIGDLQIVSFDDKKPPARWWCPLTEDIVAEDWEVVD